MIKKIFLLSTIFIILVSFLYIPIFSFSQSSCPSQTTFSDTSAVLVGEVTDHGGDPTMEVWFRWGEGTIISGSSFTHSTNRQSINASSLPFKFCANITNLRACTTYSYQAVARNNAGTNYGTIQTFTTRCQPATVDLKINGSDGPLGLNYGSSLTLTWSSSNANSCAASGAWFGSQSLSGSQTISNLTAGNYTFTLTCTGTSGSVSDSVNVQIIPYLPVVRTLPAVQTL